MNGLYLCKTCDMPTATTEDYYQQQHEKCRKALISYARSAKDEDIHRARVAIKRIKAVMTILHDSCGLDLEGHFSCYRHIFRQAGRLRDAALMRDRITEESCDRTAATHHRRMAATLSRSFRDEVPAYLQDIDHHVEDVMAEIRCSRLDLAAYCHHLHKKLKKRWRKVSKSGHYHPLRKHLKHFIYACEMLPEAERKELLSTKDTGHLEKLQDLIGQWHDAIHLDAHIHSGISDAHRLHSDLRRDTDRLQKRIVKAGDKIWG
ncbi:MAG: CHAD domain-containing protein [Bacteroidetes bacterium]|nr:CHAD domain-containing protein [Bacteroidota bacterium]